MYKSRKQHALGDVEVADDDGMDFDNNPPDDVIELPVEPIVDAPAEPAPDQPAPGVMGV